MLFRSSMPAPPRIRRGRLKRFPILLILATWSLIDRGRDPGSLSRSHESSLLPETARPGRGFKALSGPVLPLPPSAPIRAPSAVHGSWFHGQPGLAPCGTTTHSPPRTEQHNVVTRSRKDTTGSPGPKPWKHPHGGRGPPGSRLRASLGKPAPPLRFPGPAKVFRGSPDSLGSDC